MRRNFREQVPHVGDGSLTPPLQVLGWVPIGKCCEAEIHTGLAHRLIYRTWHIVGVQ